MNNKKIYTQAVIILLAASIISSFWFPIEIPFSIFIGGILALLNFRGLSKGLTGLTQGQAIKTRLIILNTLRLLMVLAVLFILMASRTVNGLGLLVGLTISFLVIFKEGWSYARKG
ncbi:MAG: ATP synthase subunit I [Nitrospirae bacterium]|nr:ATP synthase subunit I [Nitrospirota bacterium]MBF0541279.1 ATP synthase subunit I [Nitrospirota bacterium]